VELLRNTLLLLVGTVSVCTVLGVAGAWLVERTDVPWAPLWHVLLVAPLAVPAFVNSYGWVSTTHAVQSYPGAVLVVSLSYYPLVYLPMVAALRGLDPAHEEVAASLGLSRWRIFTRVVLRGTRPAMLGGALLVGLHVLAEFGALQMLQFPTFTTAIYDQYRSAFNSAPANVLAGVLVLLCLVLLVAELRLRGDDVFGHRIEVSYLRAQTEEEVETERRYAEQSREAKEKELARLQAELGVVCYAAPGRRGKLKIVA